MKVSGSKATLLFVQPTSEVGGSDLALLRLVRGLDKRAYRPIIALPGPGPLAGKIAAAGGEVRHVPMPPLRRTLNPLVQGRFAAGFLPAISSLQQLIREEGVDIVHSNSLFTPYGGAASRRCGKPHVWHIRELLGESPVRAVLVGLVRRWATEVIVMSTAVARMLAAGRRPVACRVIPDGIDLGEFHPGVSGARIRRELRIPDGAPLVTFLARLDPWKGLDVFLRAARRIREELPGARFLVAGGPIPTHLDHAQRMKTLARELGIGSCTSFTDWRYRLDDVPEVLAASTLLLHASVEPEPFGLVLIEAMACGRPVVATAAGGVLDIVEDGITGLLVPPGDVESTARAAIRILSAPDLAGSMGRMGRRRAEREFSLATCVGRVETVYRAILPGEAAA